LLGGAKHDGPVRGAALAAGTGLERADAFLRRWPSASLALLMLAAAFGGLLLARGP
jgi:hypothetical protein